MREINGEGEGLDPVRGYAGSEHIIGGAAARKFMYCVLRHVWSKLCGSSIR